MQRPGKAFGGDGLASLRGSVKAGAFVSALTLVNLAAPAEAQAPPSLDQDVLDLKTRSGVVQGSGARAFGMGGAFLARPDDATAASWNPAGLSYLRLPEFSVVGVTNRFEETTSNLNAVGEVQRVDHDSRSGRSLDFAAGAYPIQIGSFTGAAQISYQRVISFDTTRTVQNSTPDNPIVRNIHASGGFDVIAFGSGLQVTRKLRLGLTLNRWFNGYTQTLDRQDDLGRRPSSQRVVFGLSGWNVNLGVIYSPVESLNLGAVYKNGFTGNVTLERARQEFDPASGELLSANWGYRSDVTLDFPAAFGVGASWRPVSPLTLSVDYTRTQWAQGAIHNFFTLPKTGPIATADSLPYPNLKPDQPQSDTEQLRAGVEYVVIAGRLKVPLRTGFFSDRQLFPAPPNDAPPTFHGVTGGTGLIVGRLLIDFAYVYEWGSYDDYPGSDQLQPAVKARSHRVFVSLIYRRKREP
jgi:long-chain fatty acid transport protein